MTQLYQTKVLDHLGLVAGMFEELGIGEVTDQAIQQDQEKRIVSLGQAVKAMVLNGLGFVNQRLYLMPMFFQNKPTQQLIGPGIAAEHLNDDVLGRALDALYDYGVTDLYSLIATHAAGRLGLTPTFAHLDSTSFHVDGRYNSAEEPEAHVIHITQGYSRDHRPDLNQVMLDLIVENQAGIPVLMQPLSGNTNDTRDFGQVVTQHIDHLRTAHGMTYLVADSALYSEANLQKLARMGTKWITRVPATLTEASEVLEQADASTMLPLTDGYRFKELRSTYGGVEQRWVLVYSEHARPRAAHTIDKYLLNRSKAEAKAFKKLCRTEFACEEDARKALEAFAHGLHSTRLQETTIRAFPRYATRGRPDKATQPAKLRYHVEGAIVSSLAHRQALIEKKSCFILATNELDAHALSTPEVLAGYKGQKYPERGFRFLKDPLFLASSLYLKKPQRIMALLMVMTVCLLVYAALEYRLRTALKVHQETFPNQKGKPVQHPTARWIFQSFVGIHLLIIQGSEQLVLNLNAYHQQLLRLLGEPYEAYYS
jgi:transposase